MSRESVSLFQGICGIGMLIFTGLMIIAAVVCMFEDYINRDDIR